MDRSDHWALATNYSIWLEFSVQYNKEFFVDQLLVFLSHILKVTTINMFVNSLDYRLIATNVAKTNYCTGILNITSCESYYLIAKPHKNKLKLRL